MVAEHSELDFVQDQAITLDVHEVLKQNRNSPISVELQVAIIYAVVNNMLADVPTEDISAFEDALFDYLIAAKDELLSSIRDTGAISEDREAELREAILNCKSKFLGK